MPKYPDRIEYAIDRKRLIRYWRVQSFALLALLAALVYLLVVFGIIDNAMDNLTDLAPAEMVETITRQLATGFFGTLAGLVIVYLLFAHFQARGRAMRMRLLVEGPYLRFIVGSRFFRRDRRIHFRAISDYSAIDGPLLGCCGLRSLCFTVIGIGPQTVTTIPGIIDTQKVRDELCAIDAMREGPQTSV